MHYNNQSPDISIMSYIVIMINDVDEMTKVDEVLNHHKIFQEHTAFHHVSMVIHQKANTNDK